jgi:glycosyltransferase involved in cell wall biosynthesis
LRFIESNGLADSARVLPFCEDLRPWWRASDVAVCLSESDSLPASVLEAMVFGLPVLATRVGDLPELVEPGVTGWLCEPSDLGSAVAGLECVARAAPEELRRLGDAAARRMAESHDRKVVLSRMAELVLEVAG